ncbi:MAG: sigma-54-dependent Fis family transcriptional regulator [Acidimicrobiales bacterium]
MSARALYKAREQFLSDGDLAERLEGAVRPEILSSWRRSRRSGARPDLSTLPYELEGVVETPLTVATDPVISCLAEQLSGLCAGILLSDRNARIVRRWAPDPQMVRLLDRIASAVGFSGSEEYIGTNGIGTATEERQPRIVVGPEHFADVLTEFTCVGVPIRHPLSRKFEGVITLSAKAEAASPLLLPFFIDVAKKIEQRLLNQASQDERLLLDAFLTASNHGRPVAVIGTDVLMAGPKAARLMAGVDPLVEWPRLADAISSRSIGHYDTLMETADGPIRVHCEPLRDDARVIGAVLDLDPQDAWGNAASSASKPAGASRHRMVRVNREGKSSGIATIWPGGRALLPGKSEVWTTALAAAAAQVHLSGPVLILGEPGTGKSSVARAMHADLGLPDNHCVMIDCAAADPRLPDRLGGALAADSGTVVLQHLDLLEATTARNVSASLEAHIASGKRPRVIATASPVDDHGSGQAHQRLLDLLGVGRLDLPALRGRSDDIPDLVAQIGTRHTATAPPLAPKAMVALKRAPWPGNIRQLETVVRAVVASVPRGREITVEMLPAEIGIHSKRRHLTAMEQVELEAILSALGRSRGNKVLAARALGISRSTLYRKMTSYQLDPDESFF